MRNNPNQMRGFKKVQALLLRAAHHGVPHVLGTILFLAGAGIGVSLALSPHTFETQPFRENFHYSLPGAWSALFIAATLFLVVTVWVDTEHAQLPALALGIIFIAFGILTLFSGLSPVIWA